MNTTNNIITSLLVTGQIPLDAKSVVANSSILTDLGINNYKAYTYYDGLIVYCIEERVRYEWREVSNLIGTPTLLTNNFTYPDNIIVNNIDYSNKQYNFYLKPESINIASTGLGTPIYKGFNTTSETHEIYKFNSIKSLNAIISENNLLVEIKENLNKLGGGYNVYKNFDNTEKKHNILDLYSESIVFKYETINGVEVLRAELPSSSSVPGLYVNSKYIPSYKDWFDAGGDTNPNYLYIGEGTIARPYTNSIKYLDENTPSIISDTSIQNAITKYIGTGTVSAPQHMYRYLIIQNNDSQYFYAGDFNIKNFRLKLEENTYLICTKSMGYVIDMDDITIFGNDSSSLYFYLDSNSVIEFKAKIRNSGLNISSNTYANGKILNIIGNEGKILETNDYINGYTLIDSDSNSTKNYNNDGNLSIFCKNISIISTHNTIAKIGGLSKIEFNNCTIAIGYLNLPVNSNSTLLELTGGICRIFDSIIYSSELGNNRDKVIKFIPTIAANTSSSIYKPSFIVRNTRFTGYSNKWFSKENNYYTDIDIINCYSLFFSGNQLFENLGITKWDVRFRNNIFESINIDFNKVDFTAQNNISSINNIGNNIIKTLVRHPSRAAAILAGLPQGAEFINTNGLSITTPDPSWKIDIVI